MGTSRTKQITVYVKKHFRLFKNEKGWKVIVFAAIIAILVAFVLKQENVFKVMVDSQQGFFTLVSACIWTGIFNSIQSICKEREIIKHEHRTGLHISSYIISHMIYQAIICLVEALIFLLVTALFIEYPTDKALFGSIYVEFFIVFFLLLYAADVLGLAISSLVKSATTAMTVMPFILIIQLIFAGMLFPLTGVLEPISNLTISKWGLNATLISSDYNTQENSFRTNSKKLLNVAFINAGMPLEDDDIETILDASLVDTTEEDYEYTASNLFKNYAMIILHTVIYGAVAIIALEFVDKDKRA